jgi:hypothetical protein
MTPGAKIFRVAAERGGMTSRRNGESNSPPRLFAKPRIVPRHAWGMSFCPKVNRTKMFHVKHFGTIGEFDRCAGSRQGRMNMSEENNLSLGYRGTLAPAPNQILRVFFETGILLIKGRRRYGMIAPIASLAGGSILSRTKVYYPAQVTGLKQILLGIAYSLR